jgi:predicted nucleic acid-binding protein
MIIADSGPMIVFARIGRLDQVVGELVIPDAVFEELVSKGRDRSGAAEVEGGVWIHRCMVTDRAAVTLLPRVLHLGEREAVVLAEELHGSLLIDEQRGLNIVAARGIDIFGSLRIIGESKRLGLIDQAKPLIEAMQASGYWVDEALLVSFFREVGEGIPPAR